MLLQHVVMYTTKSVSSNGFRRHKSKRYSTIQCYAPFFSPLFMQKVSVFVFVLFFFSYRLNGSNSCPDCRTYLNEKKDLKSVYLRCMIDDSNGNVSELERVQTENDQLIRELNTNKTALKDIAQKWKTEKSKNTRLTKKIGELSNILKNHKHFETSPKVMNNQVVMWALFKMYCLIFIFMKECHPNGHQRSNGHKGIAVCFTKLYSSIRVSGNLMLKTKILTFQKSKVHLPHLKMK